MDKFNTPLVLYRAFSGSHQHFKNVNFIHHIHASMHLWSCVQIHHCLASIKSNFRTMKQNPSKNKTIFIFFYFSNGGDAFFHIHFCVDQQIRNILISMITTGFIQFDRFKRPKNINLTNALHKSNQTLSGNAFSVKRSRVNAIFCFVLLLPSKQKNVHCESTTKKRWKNLHRN